MPANQPSNKGMDVFSKLPRAMGAATLAVVLATVMLAAAAPVVGAVDTAAVDAADDATVDAADDATAESTTKEASALPDEPVPEPVPEPTPLPEVEEVVETVEETVDDTVETVEKVVGGEDPPAEDPPAEDPPEPTDPAPEESTSPPPPSGSGGGGDSGSTATTTTPSEPSGSVDKVTDEVVDTVNQTVSRPVKDPVKDGLPDLPDGPADAARPVLDGDVADGPGSDDAAGVLDDATDGERLDGLPDWWHDATQLAPPPDGWRYSGTAILAVGPRNTSDIVAGLAAAGLPPDQLAQVLAPFPVAGAASYSADFGAPRDGGKRSHAGTDVFADRGTPVIASADGTVSQMSTGTPLGGTSLRLTDPADGTYYYYAHLDGFAPGITNGTPVAKGDVVGYVGNTGNALLTPPHLHFQIHPRGGAPVDPVPYLDGWLDEARDEVAGLVAAGSAPEPLVAAPPQPPAAGVVPPVEPAVAAPWAAVPAGASSEPSLGIGWLVVAGIAVLLALLHGTATLTEPQRVD